MRSVHCLKTSLLKRRKQNMSQITTGSEMFPCCARLTTWSQNVPSLPRWRNFVSLFFSITNRFNVGCSNLDLSTSSYFLWAKRCHNLIKFLQTTKNCMKCTGSVDFKSKRTINFSSSIKPLPWPVVWDADISFKPNVVDIRNVFPLKLCFDCRKWARQPLSLALKRR